MSNAEAAGRVRRDVRSLLENDQGRRVLDAYGRAIRAMRALDADETRPPTNPLSWRFQAAIHGIALSGGDPVWRSCRHGSWWFLPWHRAYLHRFERIVQHNLGDPTWALP